jgi:hypothetical protein
MEPPPASLEAMVHSARRTPADKSGSSWLLWVLLVIVTAVISGYVMR